METSENEKEKHARNWPKLTRTTKKINQEEQPKKKTQNNPKADQNWPEITKTTEHKQKMTKQPNDQRWPKNNQHQPKTDEKRPKKNQWRPNDQQRAKKKSVKMPQNDQQGQPQLQKLCQLRRHRPESCQRCRAQDRVYVIDAVPFF